MKDRAKLRDQFLAKHNIDPLSLEQLPQDASYRVYYKIKNKNLLLMDAPPNKENIKSYLKVANYLKYNEFSSPDILAEDIAGGFLLIEYLGNNLYTQILEGNPHQEEELYSAAVDVLLKLHKILPPDNLIPYYSDDMLMEEADRFIDWYIPILNGEAINKKLREEYQVIWKHLLQYPRYIPETMVHKDYHADNLIWLEKRNGLKRVGILDFQDAVIGSPIYDLVSLLEDARRDVSEEIVSKMINKYIIARDDIIRKDFLASYAILGAQRNLRIIGFCARKSVRDKNNSYLKLLPRVWSYVEKNLKHPLLFPLKAWMDKVISPQVRNTQNSQKYKIGA